MLIPCMHVAEPGGTAKNIAAHSVIILNSSASDFSNIIFFSFCCQVVIGGGQDAMNVTMTDRRAGKFEAKFFHKVNYSF